LGLLNGAWFVDTGSSQAPRRVSNLIAGGAPDQLAAFTIAAIGAELPGSLIIVGLFYPQTGKDLAMLRPRWLAQAVAFGILCLGGAGLAAGLAQIHDNFSSTIFGVLTFAGSLILVFVTQTIENWLVPPKAEVEPSN